MNFIPRQDLITLFRSAGATGSVYLFQKGIPKAKGAAWSGFVGPKTTVAVVPMTTQILPFSVPVQTSDKQKVTIVGNIKIALKSDTAIGAFDFTVDKKTGAYDKAWQPELQAFVTESVLGSLRTKAKGMTIAEAVAAQAEFEQAISETINRTTDGGTPSSKLLAQKGITFESASVVEVQPDDDEVGEALGSKERQAMLTEADTATHIRQLQAADNSRHLQQFEVETALQKEIARKALIEKQGENLLQAANDEAAATKARLTGTEGADPATLLGVALLEMAKRGVGSLTVAPELLAVLKSATK